jgi:hypothetical protein
VAEHEAIVAIRASVSICSENLLIRYI